jgi:GTP pyrophosphokinase
MSKKGELTLSEAIRKTGLDPTTSDMDKVAYYFGFPRREDLFYAIEKGDVVLQDNIKKIIMGQTDNILSKLWKQTQKMMQRSKSVESKEQQEKISNTFDRTKPYLLSEDSLSRNYEIATCCKPIPGDNVLGFINDSGMVVVHKLSCRIAMRLKSSFGERILSVFWNNNTNSSFEATIEVKGLDSIGVLNTITKSISEDFNVNIQQQRKLNRGRHLFANHKA